MTTDDASVLYEPNDRLPAGLTLGMGLQGLLLSVTTTALTISLFANAAGLDDDDRSWMIFAALAVNGVATAAQATRGGPIGCGHVLMVGTAPSYLAVTLLAAERSDARTLATLIVVSSCVQFILARWLPRARQIITPSVGGIVLMLIAVTVAGVAVGRLAGPPGGTASSAGPAVAALTVAVAAMLGLRAKGRVRLWSPLIGIAVACVVAALFGLFDSTRVSAARWIALPEPQLPGVGLTASAEFWSLLPMFVVVSMAAGLLAMSSGVIIQQVSWRNPPVTDFRLVQGAMNTNGAATLIGGFFGALPTVVYGPTSATMTTLTGVASRRVGYSVGAMLVAVAFAPKATAVLASIPDAVTAGYLLVIMGMVFVEGMRAVAREGLARHRALIVGISLGIGFGLQGSSVVADLIGGAWGALLGNGMVAGTIAAIALTAFVEVSGRRRQRLEVELHIDSLGPISEFLDSLAAGAGWSEASRNRLRLVGEEALASLLEDRSDGSQARLVVIARSAPNSIELQFLAALEEQNLEEQLACLSERAEVPEERTISLHLLRHFASTVRHRKYSGIDIVTVEVDRSR